MIARSGTPALRRPRREHARGARRLRRGRGRVRGGQRVGLVYILARVHPDGIDAVSSRHGVNGSIAVLVPAAALAVRARREAMPVGAVRPGGLSFGARIGELGSGRRAAAGAPGRLPVCLPLAAREGTGAVTSFGYAYLIGSALVAVTASSLGLVTSVPLTQGRHRRRSGGAPRRLHLLARRARDRRRRGGLRVAGRAGRARPARGRTTAPPSAPSSAASWLVLSLGDRRRSASPSPSRSSSSRGASACCRSSPSWRCSSQSHVAFARPDARRAGRARACARGDDARSSSSRCSAVLDAVRGAARGLAVAGSRSRWSACWRSLPPAFLLSRVGAAL